MAQTSRTVNLARATVNCRCHVCAFFNSRDDEEKVMLPFFKEGLDVGDRAVSSRCVPGRMHTCGQAGSISTR
jgi:hypothetical protein